MGKQVPLMDRFCQMDDDELERFSLGQTSDEEAEEFEEHLLVCEFCRERFETVDDFAQAMHSAAAALRAEELEKAHRRKRLAWLVPVFAALVLIVTGVLTLTRQTAPPLGVALIATRGTEAGRTVPAGRALSVAPDLTGIAVPGPYRIEVIDDRGAVTGRGRYDGTSGAVIPAQRLGVHYVRVFGPGGELLREYGLLVQR
ncbi:MAG: hypothetical protein KGN36_01060 [Acidobacteriota bacterium]|nr:hypothetical protein [Acidobacteriota bacterium]